jgi:hypothetical protein
MPDRLRILDATLRWSRETSYGYAVAALGPSYLLSYVIEYPTPSAGALRTAVTEARDALLTFLHTAQSS